MAKPAPSPRLDEDSAAVETTTAPAPAVAASKPGQGGDAPTPADAPAAAAPPPSGPVLTLDEYCTRKSEGSRQPHAITAFYSEESKGERYRDTAEAFDARFVAMMERPAL